MRYASTLEKAKIVKTLVAENYEEGRQDRCRLWVYRNIVNKRLPMSQRTFFRLLHTDTGKGRNPQDYIQLSLFPDLL